MNAIKENRFGYDGNLPTLFKLFMLNAVLTICTLGIYQFWGKTRARKYISASTSLLGDRFEYTGTGKELFIGFLKAFLAYMVITLLVVGGYVGALKLAQTSPAIGGILLVVMTLIVILLYIFLYVALFAGMYGAARYRASRTNWRGIRAHLAGSKWQFAIKALGYVFIGVITLFLAAPTMALGIQRLFLKDAYVGDKKVKYTPNTEDLWASHWLTLILAPFTLGISRFWYHARLYKCITNGIHVDNLSLSNYYTAGKLFRLSFINMLLWILPFVVFFAIVGKSFFISISLMMNGIDPALLAGSGIEATGTGQIIFAYIAAILVGFAVHAFIINRCMRYFVQNITVNGDIDASDIKQGNFAKDTSGEGLDQLFNGGDAF